MSAVEYVKGAELGDLTITWRDTDGTLINFSSGYSFEVKIGVVGSAAAVTKATSITGASTAPNVTISWSTSDLSSLSTGDYVLQLKATEVASSKDRILQKPLRIKPAIS